MKKMTTILLSLFIFLFVFLFFSSFLGFLFDRRTPSTKMGHKIAAEVGKKLEAKYGVDFRGISEEGTRDDKYIKIGFELYYRKILSKDEGRVLLLKCAKEALEILNSHPEFEQYMTNIPFTNRNIIINIYVHPLNADDVYHPDFAVLSFFNNKLWYKTNSPTHVPTFKQLYYTEETETFEEAVKIIESQKNNSTQSRRTGEPQKIS